jgi:hypothetical protein
MTHALTRYTDVVEIVGDILKVRIGGAGHDGG